jgi:hypothetical protein
MSDIDLLIVAQSRVTTLTHGQLEAEAYRRGMGTPHDDGSVCRVFNDKITGAAMRTIGEVYYSPGYTKKRGGPWRIRTRNGATASDRCVLLEVINSVMEAGVPFTDTWESQTFVNTTGWFRYRPVCRPLSDYEGEELYTMVNLPADVEAAGFLSAVEKVILPVGLETIAFETRSSDVGVQL